MRRSLFLSAILLLSLPSSYAQQPDTWKWTVSSTPKQDGQLPWCKFFWVPGKLGGKQYDKTAMMIPVRVEGCPYYFNFQFDMGSDATMLYGRTAASLTDKCPGRDLRVAALLFGDHTAVFSHKIFLNEKFGAKAKKFDTVADLESPDLGTIGVDMFQDKVLIIDYPNERFSICDEVPAAYATTMTTFTDDGHGRVILPMQKGDQRYRVMFDNGSSIFQLITASANIDKFSTAAPVEEMKISSWGHMQKVSGRPMKEPFTLAGRTYSDIIVYENPTGISAGEGYDAITGNALFYDRVLVIDMKHKQVGIK